VKFNGGLNVALRPFGTSPVRGGETVQTPCVAGPTILALKVAGRLTHKDGGPDRVTIGARDTLIGAVKFAEPHSFVTVTFAL
jgi:hypothetical protein